MEIGEDHFVEAAKAIAQSYGGILPVPAEETARWVAGAFIRGVTDLSTSGMRLEGLQRVLAELKPRIEAGAER
jgi:hypothetical protein